VYVQQIDALELKATLNAMGQNPTEEEIFQMISQVDDDNSGEIEFAEFLKVIENQKTTAAKANDETDTIDAFIALGGQPNKTGEISTDKLKEVIKVC
jgi:Ca2+-binding EF-hand superfamily protein|tara:strand:+ start:183 stop:473 length:291 start_codon:yes stop_codon:yes gene_type:complete